MGRRIIALLFALLLALPFVGPAEAHSSLVRSEPSPGALLDATPAMIVLEFNEELDPSFSSVQLLDSKNQVIEPGPGQIEPQSRLIMRLPLLELPKDSYTAVWKVRSAVDGHVTQGSVPFGVGVTSTLSSLIPPPGAPDPATEVPPPLDSAVRWLNLLGAAVALGGLPFGLLVWRPALRAATTDHGPPTADHGPPTTDHGPPTTDHGRPRRARPTGSRFSILNSQFSILNSSSDLVAVDETMTRALRRLLLGGGVLFILTSLLFLVAQAALAAGVPIVQAFGAPIMGLLGGRTGLLLLARLALVFQVVVLSWRLPPLGQGRTRLWWIALAIGMVALLTFSLNSHGAAAGQDAAVAIVLDWLHLAAMVAWIGGLIPLALAVGVARRFPDRALPLAALIPRFSRLSAVCLVTLTLTGIYSYVLHINRLDLLAATTYGRALVVKLGLFGLLLLLGGLNLFILSPRLRASGNRLARAFTRNVRAELVIGMLLLLVVGAMTSVAPSKTAWEEHERLGLMQEATLDDVHLVLRVAPAQIGDNEFAVDVTDRRPGAQDAPSKVLLNFDMVGMGMGKLQTETQAQGTERYTTRGSFVSMGGRWEIEVVLRRAGFDDVRHTFQVDVVRVAAQAP